MNSCIDNNALSSLPELPTDISSSLHHSNTTDPTSQLSIETPISLTEDSIDQYPHHTSSFIPTIPNRNIEIQEIRHYLQSYNHHSATTIQWPPISLSPINEYNTEGLLSMAFPTLFPTGAALPNQPRIKTVQLHEYALHLLHYHDNRFGKHPRFRYYIYNLMMRHRSQATTSFFVKKNIGDGFPTSIQELNIRLQQFPDDKLAEQVMRFGSSLRGTRSFWHKAKNELTDMISQLGCPTFFFTLSAADTKWPDLHAIMPGNPPPDVQLQHKWRNDNIISNPHLTSLYMHHRFTIFREVILEKHLQTKDYWYRYLLYHMTSIVPYTSSSFYFKIF